MLEFMNQIRTETVIVIEELNLGGGFGIKYVDSDKPVPYGDYMKEIKITKKIRYDIVSFLYIAVSKSADLLPFISADCHL